MRHSIDTSVRVRIYLFGIGVLQIVAVGLLVGCSPSGGSISLSSLAIEAPFCSTANTFPSGITVQGAAAYTKRLAVSGGLSANESPAYPIRFAEIQVLNQSGVPVQCAQTDGAGNFLVTLPGDGSHYKIEINSRGSNAHVLASVVDAPETARYYSLVTSIVADRNQTLSTLTAHANGDVLGGAFNIFDDLVKANEFLLANTSACGEFLPTCKPYTASYKCNVFWKSGFNPAAYLGSTSGLSFYLPGTSDLYILGGKNGDTDNSDTDHFDDSVIVHEYGHFIEDHYGRTNSPGGFHSATRVIDPRLAWGEGWADFFSSAVLNQSTYVDTCGNLSGSPCGDRGYLFNVDIRGPDFDYPAARVGEGNFHELSITSTFYNFITAGQVTSSGRASRFNELWATFTGPFRDERYAFRNFGLFMQLHNTALSQSTPFSTELTARYQRPDQTDYALPLSVGGRNCGFNVNYGNTNLYFDPRVDWLQNNDIYQINVTTPGSYTFMASRLSGEVTTDVDLYLYSEDHRYLYEGNCGNDELCFSQEGLIARNASSDAIGNSNVQTSAVLSPGRYLLVVNIAGNQTGNGTDNLGHGDLNYGLSMNGVPLCGN